MNHHIEKHYFSITKNYNKILLLFFLFNTSILLSQNGMEYWSDYELSKSVSEQLTIKIKPSFRIDDKLTNHYWSDISIGVNFEISRLTQGGIYFRPISIKSTDSWKTEYRPYADIEIQSPLKHFNIKDRNRVEVRLKRNENSIWYRNKLSTGEIVLIKNVMGIGFADEVFIDFGKRNFNMNRIYIDIKYHILNNTIFGLSFIKQQKLSNDNWSYTNIIRSAIIYKI